jgi:hypothetical protein
MRILNMALLLACGAIVAACDDDEPETCKTRICPVAPDRPSEPLAVDVQVSGSWGWDSVWVEFHSGTTVEQGALLASWGVGRGADASRTVWVGEGDYSGHAVYMRAGDTLDAYDADETSISENKDECGCTTGWTRNEGTLDLRDR